MRQTFLLANTLHDPDPALTQYLEQRCIVMLGRRPAGAPVYPEQREIRHAGGVAQQPRAVALPAGRRADRAAVLRTGRPGRARVLRLGRHPGAGAAAMAAPIPCQPFAPGAVAARLMARNRHWYWNEAQDAMLPLGQISARALTHHEDQAAFSDFWLAAEFGNLANDAQLRGQAGLVADGEGYCRARRCPRYALPGEPALYHQETGTLWSSPDAAPTARPPSATTLPMRVRAAHRRIRGRPGCAGHPGPDRLPEPGALAADRQQRRGAAGAVRPARQRRRAIGVRRPKADGPHRRRGPGRLHMARRSQLRRRDRRPGLLPARRGRLHFYDFQAPSATPPTRQRHHADTQPLRFRRRGRRAHRTDHRIHRRLWPGGGRQARMRGRHGRAARCPGALQRRPGPAAHGHDAAPLAGLGRTVYNNKGLPAQQYPPYYSNIAGYEAQQELADAGLVPPPRITRYDPLGPARGHAQGLLHRHGLPALAHAGLRRERHRARRPVLPGLHGALPAQPHAGADRGKGRAGAGRALLPTRRWPMRWTTPGRSAA